MISYSISLQMVLREICHMKIKGHLHHYWDLFYRYLPDYQDKIDGSPLRSTDNS